MYTLLSGFWKLWFSKDQYQVLILGLDGSGKTTLLEQLRHMYSNSAPPSSLRIPPTVGLNVGRLSINRSINWQVWDLGGQAGLRVLWDKYFSECHALIYVIDCSIDRSIVDSLIAGSNDGIDQNGRLSDRLIDRLIDGSIDGLINQSTNQSIDRPIDRLVDRLIDRLDESLSELAKLVSDTELNEAPVLILSNKQDTLLQLGGESLNKSINQAINQSIKEICLIDQSNRPIKIVEVSALTGAGIAAGVNWLNKMIKQSTRTKRLQERMK